MSMFDALKNMGNLNELMDQAKRMQEQVQAMQEEMGRKTVTADAGGGMAQATVNGRLELVKLKIDQTKIDLNDVELLEDVIIAAVHGAQTKAAEMMKEEMGKMTGQLGIPPGMLPE
jgi:DNA-binding YbaB/EbfC family protein